MYENMTDDEFFAEVEKLYGADWIPDDLPEGSEIAAEYARRVAQGF